MIINYTKELINNLSKYKIRSKVEIKDLSSNYVVGIMNFENFKDNYKKAKS